MLDSKLEPSKIDLYVIREYDKEGNLKVKGIRAWTIAEHLLSKYIFVYASAPSGTRGDYYIYDDSGVYKKIDEKEIKTIIQNFLISIKLECIVRKRHVEEVFQLMSYKIKSVSYDDFNSNENLINFKNGVLNLNTLELSSHKSDYLSSRQVPCNWNPDAKDTPVFDKFLNDLTKNIEDADEVKKMLMEFIGVCISNIPGYRYKTSLLLYGPGNTGKTQFRNLIGMLIGKENTQQLELNDLDKDFATGGLYGKRMFGSDDMSYIPSRDLSKFKTITGGGDVLITQKFKDSFTSILSGVFINCSNSLPKFGGDRGDWVYERIRVVKLTNVISKEKQDAQIMKKMSKEYEGIVVKAIKAMIPTIESYRYTFPESVKENGKEYKTINNMVLEFFEEFCEITSNPTHSEAEIRKCFVNWASINYSVTPPKDEFERYIAEMLKTSIPMIKHRTSKGRFYTFDISDDCYKQYSSRL